MGRTGTDGRAVLRAVGPLRRQRLVDEATRSLRDAILAGRLQAGLRLRQTDLADRLHISRTPIREALGRLQQEGLVELLPRGGVQVVLLDLEQAAELYDLREVLDGLAARLAAGRATAASLGRLEQALERMARSVEAHDANRWFPAHVRFHEGIFRASGHRRLQGLLGVVRLSIRHFHPLLLRTPKRLQAAYAEHRALYEAIRRRDAERAERLARAHIANAKAVVFDALADRDRGEPGGAVQA